MRVLIVEDQNIKRQNAISILKRVGVTDYITEKYVSKVLQKNASLSCDLIITDLGLPRFLDGEIEDPYEGLKMMYDLTYSGIQIPTIIFSKTELYDEQIDYLSEIEYPLIGQAGDARSLEKILKDYLSSENIDFQDNTIKHVNFKVLGKYK